MWDFRIAKWNRLRVLSKSRGQQKFCYKTRFFHILKISRSKYVALSAPIRTHNQTNRWMGSNWMCRKMSEKERNCIVSKRIELDHISRHITIEMLRMYVANLFQNQLIAPVTLSIRIKAPPIQMINAILFISIAQNRTNVLYRSNCMFHFHSGVHKLCNVNNVPGGSGGRSVILSSGKT